MTPSLGRHGVDLCLDRIDVRGIGIEVVALRCGSNGAKGDLPGRVSCVFDTVT